MIAIIKKIILLTTLLTFMSQAVLSEAAELAREDVLLTPARHDKRGYNFIKCDNFMIPEHLGEIKDKFQASSDKLVIHIQDAHCNYSAQKKISDIISYIVAEYDVDTVNVEGGAGDYDLSPFTGITGAGIRKEISEYFLKKGEINAAEFYAVNNPGKAKLWGVENKNIYLKNLQVYRNFLPNKAETDELLQNLSGRLEQLKFKLFNKELLDIDLHYRQYKTGKEEFRDYLVFLFERGVSGDVSLAGLENLNFLYKAMRIEAGIDFQKAGLERDLLVDYLKKYLSKNEIREMMSILFDYKARKISKNDFYSYLINTAEETRYVKRRYKNFFDYCTYLAVYSKIDRSGIMRELEMFEDRIKATLFENKTQSTLDRLSKNLTILKNIFSFSLTLDDYEYYRKNEKDFSVRIFTDFIANNQAFTLENPAAYISKLDESRKEIAGFFKYSFERDRVFMKKMRFSDEPDTGGPRTALIITGGFHTENLCGLLKDNNISFISVMPRFCPEENYKSPYFELLAGRSSEAAEMMRSVLAKVSTLMVANKLNPELRAAVYGSDAGLILRGEIIIRELAGHGFSVALREKEKDISPVIFGRSVNGNIDITASRLIETIRNMDKLDAISKDLMNTVSVSLKGDLQNFTMWTDIITKNSDKELDSLALALIGIRLGLRDSRIGKILFTADKKAAYLADFYEKLPDDAKHNVYLFRDAFFMYLTEKLYGGDPQLFYFSKFLLEFFSDKTISMAYPVNILFSVVKKEMGLKEDEDIPYGKLSIFREKFYEILKDIYTMDVDVLKPGEKVYNLSHDKITGFKKAISKFMAYLGTLNLSREDILNNGIRIIDSSKVGTLSLFSEAALRLFLEEMGLGADEARERVDTKMFYSRLSPELGFSREIEVDEGHLIERENWPVRINKSVPVNNLGRPTFVEDPDDKLAFIFEQAVLTNKIREKRKKSEITAETEKKKPALLTEVLKKTASVALFPLRIISRTGNFIVVLIFTVLLSITVPGNVQAGNSRTALLLQLPSLMQTAHDLVKKMMPENIVVYTTEDDVVVYVYKMTRGGELIFGVNVETDLPGDDLRVAAAKEEALRVAWRDFKEFRENAPGTIEGLEKIIERDISEDTRDLRISDEVKNELFNVLQGTFGDSSLTERDNIEFSVDISNSAEYLKYSKEAYDLLVNKGLLAPDTPRYPILFLNALNRPGLAMALFRQEVILVGLDELLELRARGKDLVEELAIKIPHEAKHLYNKIHHPGMPLLEDEAHAFGETARTVEAFSDDPVQIKAQRMVAEAFWTLAGNMDPDGTPTICRLLGIPDIRYIYYKDVSLVREHGGFTGVDIYLYDLRDPAGKVRQVRVIKGKILMFIFETRLRETSSVPNDIINSEPDIFYADKGFVGETAPGTENASLLKGIIDNKFRKKILKMFGERGRPFYDNFLGPVYEEIIYTGVPVFMGFLLQNFSQNALFPILLLFRLNFVWKHIKGERAPPDKRWKIRTLFRFGFIPSLISSLIIAFTPVSLSGMFFAAGVHISSNIVIQPLLNRAFNFMDVDLVAEKGSLLNKPVSMWDTNSTLPFAPGNWTEIGPVEASNIYTHSLVRYRNNLTAEEFIVKRAAPHSLRSELIGQRIFKLAGLPVPEMRLFTLNGELVLLIEYLEGFDVSPGDIMPEQSKNNPDMIKAFLLDLLVYNYDRAPWNLMTAKGKLAFIDFGASTISRAQGGKKQRAYKGFPDHISAKQVRSVIRANKVYAGFLGNPDFYAELIDALAVLGGISEDAINKIVDEAYFDVSAEEMKQTVLSRLKAFQYRENPDYEYASETFKTILDKWAGNEQEYIKFALKARLKQLLPGGGIGASTATGIKSTGEPGKLFLNYLSDPGLTSKAHYSGIGEKTLFPDSGANFLSEKHIPVQGNNFQPGDKISIAKMAEPIPPATLQQTDTARNETKEDYDTIRPSKNSMNVSSAYEDHLWDLQDIENNERLFDILARKKAILAAEHPDQNERIEAAFNDIKVLAGAGAHINLVMLGRIMAAFINYIIKSEPDRHVVHFARDMGLTYLSQKTLSRLNNMDNNSSAFYLNREMMGDIYHELNNNLSNWKAAGKDTGKEVEKWFFENMAKSGSKNDFVRLAEITYEYLKETPALDENKLLLLDTGFPGTMPWYLYGLIRYYDRINKVKARDLEVLLLNNALDSRQIDASDYEQDDLSMLKGEKSLADLLKSNGTMANILEGLGEERQHPVYFDSSISRIISEPPARQLYFNFISLLFENMAVAQYQKVLGIEEARKAGAVIPDFNMDTIISPDVTTPDFHEIKTPGFIKLFEEEKKLKDFLLKNKNMRKFFNNKYIGNAVKVMDEFAPGAGMFFSQGIPNISAGIKHGVQYPEPKKVRLSIKSFLPKIKPFGLFSAVFIWAGWVILTVFSNLGDGASALIPLSDLLMLTSVYLYLQTMFYRAFLSLVKSGEMIDDKYAVWNDSELAERVEKRIKAMGFKRSPKPVIVEDMLDMYKEDFELDIVSSLPLSSTEKMDILRDFSDMGFWFNENTGILYIKRHSSVLFSPVFNKSSNIYINNALYNWLKNVIFIHKNAAKSPEAVLDLVLSHEKGKSAYWEKGFLKKSFSFIRAEITGVFYELVFLLRKLAYIIDFVFLSGMGKNRILQMYAPAAQYLNIFSVFYRTGLLMNNIFRGIVISILLVAVLTLVSPQKIEKHTVPGDTADNETRQKIDPEEISIFSDGTIVIKKDIDTAGEPLSAGLTTGGRDIRASKSLEGALGIHNIHILEKKPVDVEKLSRIKENILSRIYDSMHEAAINKIRQKLTDPGYDPLVSANFFDHLLEYLEDLDLTKADIFISETLMGDELGAFISIGENISLPLDLLADEDRAVEEILVRAVHKTVREHYPYNADQQLKNSFVAIITAEIADSPGFFSRLANGEIRINYSTPFASDLAISLADVIGIPPDGDENIASDLERREAIVDQPETDSSFIGKLLNEKGEIVSSFSRVEEDNGAISVYDGENRLLVDLPLKRRNGRKKKISTDEIIRNMLKDTMGRQLKAVHMEKKIEEILSLLRFSKIKEIVLLEQASGTPDIKGLFYDSKLYINEYLFDNPLALMHELGEGHITLPEGDAYAGLTRHTLMRGAGKDVRTAFGECKKAGKDFSGLDASGMIDMLEKQLQEMESEGRTSVSRREQVNNRTETTLISRSEKALIEYNAANGLWGIELLYGVQDFVDPAGNLRLTRNIRILTDDLRGGTLNIYLIPYGNIESRQAQEECSRKTSRKFRKMGQNTLIFHYDDTKPIKDQLKKALDMAKSEENKNKLPKIYISTFDKKKIESLIKEILKEGDYPPEDAERINRMIIIGTDTLPEGADSINDIAVDDVRTIAIGSAILNDNRLRVDLELSPERLFENRLRMLNAFVDSGILEASVFSDKTVEGLERIMKQLYAGDIPMKITPVRWEDITEYHDSMRQVLRSL